MAELTPMKKQYLEIKSQHPDCLLFFRLGDFYEMFDDDAKTAAAELNLTLTTRDRNKPPEQRTPMCGVPYHSSEAYISRLIAKGYKVAICEQTEDPAQAKGLVDREVIRVVTPGTLIEENMLEEGKNNFLAALYSGPQGAGLCLGDISTGEVFLTQFDPAGWQEHAINELARFSPREIILSPGACEEGLLDYLSAKLSCRVEHASEARFDLAAAQARVTQQFTVGLDHVPGDARPAIQAAGGLLSYLYETQKTDLSYLHTVRYYSTGRFLELDPVARRNLELTETLRGKEKKGSLLWVLDKTKTAMGGRQLRSWLERPLLDPVAISRRLDAVGWLVDHSVEREELTQVLREITDLERLISRIVYGTAGARDLVALAAGLRRLPELQNYLPDKSPVLLARLRELQGIVAQGSSDPESPFLISTIHSSKGLEYQRVILMDVADGILPSIDPPRGSHPDPEEVELYEEERRLFYVGMTRAKEELAIFRFRREGLESTFANTLFPYDQKVAHPPERESGPREHLSPGDRVDHKIFGPGRIVSRQGDIASIRFEDGTEKRFALAAAVKKNLIRKG
ncbi:MAG: hypothetical protein EGQ60_00650 [Clostridiales bacterium]|nr:hypothetical protein [Clostridiales bacterium]